jgi:rhamnulokinase
VTGPAGAAVATVAAVDLGASGGRVMAGRVGPGVLELREAHRFPNLPVAAGGTLHWDILGLYREILDGLRAAADGCELASAGIDSWGVDYGLIDSGGAMLGYWLTGSAGAEITNASTTH